MMNYSSHTMIKTLYCATSQRKSFVLLYLSLFSLLLLTLSSCAIVDDIPYPIIDTEITAFEVEGMCDATGEDAGTATIDKTTRTIDIFHR